MEQMPSNSPIMESKPGPAGWLPVWIKAVTKPNEQTFVEITESPDAVSRTAFIWVFIAGTVSGIVQAILLTIQAAMGVSPLSDIPDLEQFAQGGGGGAGMVFIIALCFSPIAGVISVIGFALGAALVQWVAKLFGGVGTFEKLAYAFAAITVPFTLVSVPLTLLGAIPFVGICTGILSLGLGIYALVLQVMAVKAVNRIGWGQAIGSILIIPGSLILCSILTITVLLLMGPAIGNVFSEINQSLAP